MNLSEIHISPDDVVESYGDLASTFDEYLEMSAFMHLLPNATFGDYAKDNKLQCGTSEYDRLKKNFRYWIKNDSMPRTAAAVIALHQSGIFPATEEAKFDDVHERMLYGEIGNFDSTNKKFRLAALASSIEFWRGCLIKQWSGRTAVSFRLTPEYIDQLVSDILSALMSPKELTQHIDSAHSRFMSLFGAFSSRKKNSEQILPAHIECALETVRSQKTSDQERELARDILIDFVLALFYLEKGNFSGCAMRRGELFLPGSIDRCISEQRAAIFVNVLGASKVPLGSVRPAIQSHKREQLKDKRTTFAPRIKFLDIGDEDIRNFRESFRARAEEVLKGVR